MTTPGQQLTPGDDQNPPEFGVPEGAYVGTAGQSNSITDLNNLTEAEAKNRMKSSVAGPFGRQRDGVWGFFSLITGVVQGVVDVVVGGVTAVVDGIGQIFNAIGSLFGAARRDTSAVDAARVAGENAIVANMGDALDQLDEIQRAGGAYMRYPFYDILNAETSIYVLPLSDPMPLQVGTRWIDPVFNTEIESGERFTDSSNTRSAQARRSGQLELIESGLWMIFFQASVLQGNQYTSRPVDLFCHVTDANSPWLPVGPPGLTSTGSAIPGMQMARHRDTGDYGEVAESGFLQAYGRAGSYIGIRDTAIGGGNSVFGMVPALLPSPGWKVSLSVSTFARFGGPATTYVFAYQVNSESLRDDIDAMKVQLAQDLPGQSVDMLLDEASIAAMVAEAENLEVPDVVVPTDPPEAGNG